MTPATNASAGNGWLGNMIDVIIEDHGWEAALPDAESLAAACFEAASGLEPGIGGEIALLLTNDKALRALNARFRDKDKPTNVLSFPSGEESFLGDIAIALETCRKEAAEKNIALRDHTAHLITHGMLHLIGYDHEQDDDAETMEKREAEILNILGIADPYADAVERI
jgi:probable rRNA maturation factor